MSEKIIEVKHMTKIYNPETRHATTALHDISLVFKKGEFVCIMGTSGSGKTTLLNNLSTIDTPTKGEVYINGKNVNHMSESDLCKFRTNVLGFIFQNYNVIDTLTIYENIRIPLLIKKETDFDEKIDRILKQLDIEEIKNKYPYECSGGQVQRVAIARALVSEPSIIVADEPTGNLDSHNSFELLELLKKLNQEGISILMVTHDSFVASYSSKLLFLKDGEISDIIERENMSQNEYYDTIESMNLLEIKKIYFDKKNEVN